MLCADTYHDLPYWPAICSQLGIQPSALCWPWERWSSAAGRLFFSHLSVERVVEWFGHNLQSIFIHDISRLPGAQRGGLNAPGLQQFREFACFSHAFNGCRLEPTDRVISCAAPSRSRKASWNWKMP